MFDKITRLLGFGVTSDDPESFDPSRPQRANPNPPRRDWFARVSERSAAARASRAVAEAKALDALDANEPALTREAARAADELLARVEGGARVTKGWSPDTVQAPPDPPDASR